MDHTDKRSVLIVKDYCQRTIPDRTSWRSYVPEENNSGVEAGGVHNPDTTVDRTTEWYQLCRSRGRDSERFALPSMKNQPQSRPEGLDANLRADKANSGRPRKRDIVTDTEIRAQINDRLAR